MHGATPSSPAPPPPTFELPSSAASLPASEAAERLGRPPTGDGAVGGKFQAGGPEAGQDDIGTGVWPLVACKSAVGERLKVTQGHHRSSEIGDLPSEGEAAAVEGVWRA
mmetsp:Transcript_30149/g.79669  ORF Transcript_30149/g.79669 Transcript_30149/m.79669 type:complete len:109 (-) Transcript_30149:1430-1756(-)